MTNVKTTMNTVKMILDCYADITAGEARHCKNSESLFYSDQLTEVTTVNLKGSQMLVCNMITANLVNVQYYSNDCLEAELEAFSTRKDLLLHAVQTIEIMTD
ncbi:hypothetical protein [Candidatus Enterococcus clewellii]|uniref:Uncharacterized protein n=1 Tax=Candidatus Enterococcus clewellii TaxID=1834193 RepID=A0A242KDY0_9ENTE|nr:hypothetical protein [Enterococcus sp. 9E7_DIV0242]OTP18750.1 hypothetical protein A5888_000564 [Enterococcus sp. 9E7_DIV0242]